MRDIFTWLLRLCKWSAEPRELWLCIAGVIAAIGLFLIVSHSRSDAFRYAGLMLQVMGVLTVIRGLRGRGKLFGIPTLRSSAAAWIARFPRYKPRPITLAGASVSSAATSGSGIIVCWQSYHDKESLEQQLSALAENFETLRKELGRITNELSGHVQKVDELLQLEKTTRMTEVSQLHSTLTVLGTSGLFLEMIGTSWMLLGIVLATIPEEIACIFTSTS